ncbi:MAG: response regulator [Gemmatimonadales bacterium]|nr:MAG: response regulator [Gemmatimonadales bacterium]
MPCRRTHPGRGPAGFNTLPGMRLVPSTLRGRALLLMGVVLAVAAGLIVLEIRSEFQQSRALAEQQVADQAALLASQMDAVADEVLALATRLAARPAVAELDASTCEAWIGEARALIPGVARFLLADGEGQVVCAADAEPGRPAPVGGRSWFGAVMETGEPATGRPEETPDGRWVLPVAVPVASAVAGDPPMGVVAVSLRLERIQTLVDAAGLQEGSVLTVVDSAWVALARSSDPQRWVGGSLRGLGLVDPRSPEAAGGVFLSPGADGVDRIWAWAEPGAMPWYVLAGVPEEVALAPALATVRSHSLVGVLILLLFLGSFLLLTTNVGRVLDRLRTSVVTARTAPATRVPVEGPLELRGLGAALNGILEARDRAEEELAGARDRHDLVLRASRDMIWDWDLVAERVRRSSTLQTFAGLDAIVSGDSAMGRWWDRVPEPDRSRVRRSLEAALEGGETTWVEEYPVRTEAGGRARVLDRAHIVRRSDGEAVRVVGAMTDVTEERRRTDEVRRAKERYESILRNAPFGVFLAGPEGHLMEWNPALARILGESWEGSLPSRRAQEFFADPEAFHAFAREAREEGAVIGREALWVRADGEELHMRLTASAFLERGRVALEVLAEDVSERRRLGEQVRQSQKMEAVGRLAGGVAHDFNNLLTVISGEARLLLGAEEALDEELAESLEAIREAGDRGSRLTRQLLAFSRRNTVERRPLELNGVIEDLRRMLVRLLGEKVRLRADLAPDLPLVMGDPGELEQVLVNLAVNARDAMPEGGEVVVGTTHFELESGEGGRHAGLQPGSWVVLSVRDEGIGMDERTLSRVFEPFFSTKTKGKGTGLGLSTVYGIITRNGGQVDVESEPGRGTLFRLYLPVASRSEVEQLELVDGAGSGAGGAGGAGAGAGSGAGASRPAARGGALRGSAGSGEDLEGTVALVEDEAPVRRMAERVLERAGYRVLSWGDPREAVEALGPEGPPVDLLVSDIRMPGMDGDRMVALIREGRPELPVLFVSGYPEEVQLQDRLRDGRTLFLAKPFRPDSLLEYIRRLRMSAAAASRR